MASGTITGGYYTKEATTLTVQSGNSTQMLISDDLEPGWWIVQARAVLPADYSGRFILIVANEGATSYYAINSWDVATSGLSGTKEVFGIVRLTSTAKVQIRNLGYGAGIKNCASGSVTLFKIR